MHLRIFGLDPRDVLLVIGSFAAASVLYALLGVEFDGSTFPHYMQFIDENLLVNHMLESLWYFHAHPPLLNLFVGLGYKMFGPGADVFFTVVFHTLGVLIALSVYALTWRLSSSRIAAGIVTVLLVFSPAFVLYENWLMYTFPSVALLTISAFLLYQYAQTRKTSWCVAFFSVLAALLLLRSLFHLAWLLVIIAMLTVVLWERRRQVLMAAAVPLLVVVFWYGKNYYLFGTFSSSTMLGLGLSNITTLMVPKGELQPLVEAGKLSPFALVSRYDERHVFFASQPHLKPTGHPVLDEVYKADDSYNYNNVQMVALNRVFTHDAVGVLRTFPSLYVTGLTISNRLFFSPPSMNFYFSAVNRTAAHPMEAIFNPVLYGTGNGVKVMQLPNFGFPSAYTLEVNTSIPLIVMWWAVLGYAYVQARRVFKDRSNIDARTVIMGFFCVTGLYLYVVGTGLELAENYRYRYNIEPLFLVVTAVALTDLVRAVRARLAKPMVATQSPVS